MSKQHFYIFLLLFLAGQQEIAGQAVERPENTAPFNWRYFQVNSGISGARANSLGGAFVGVADDATAATINPAGLTVLTRPETYAHIRLRGSDIQELSGNPHHWSEKRSYYNFETDLSYGSVVIPLRQYTFAAHWDIFTRAANEFEYQQVTRPNIETPLELEELLGGRVTLPGRKVHFDLQIINMGLAVARTIPKLPMSVGFSFQVTRLNFSLTEKLFFHNSLLQPATSSRPVFYNRPQNLYSLRTIDDNDWDFSYSVGVLLKPTSNVGIGLVYHERPQLKIHSEIFFPTYFLNETAFLPATSEIENIYLKLPDSFGVGIGCRLTKWFRMSADLMRINYADILETYPLKNLYQLAQKDTYEFHLGMEYLIPLRKFDLALRGGFFYSPFHYPFTKSELPACQILYPQEKDRTYFTCGGGIGINKIKSDLSFKLASHLREVESIISIGIRL